jgi:hypothetical protein
MEGNNKSHSLCGDCAGVKQHATERPAMARLQKTKFGPSRINVEVHYEIAESDID